MGAKSLKNRASEGGSNGWVQSGRSLGVRGYPWLCPREARTRAKRGRARSADAREARFFVEYLINSFLQSDPEEFNSN